MLRQRLTKTLHPVAITRSAARAFTPVSIGIAALVVAGWFHLKNQALLASHPAPKAWAKAARPNDRLKIPGHSIAYWGKPDARYSVYGTKGLKKPTGVIVHFTGVRPVLDLVKYGHVQDHSRGGGSFGYHFYIGRKGGIAQGAPLSRRTNHIKSTKRAERTHVARNLWAGNAIGISLIGGCDRVLRPMWWNWSDCGDEYVTQAQYQSGLAVIRAIQRQFVIPCSEVYGHGELQTDREDFEGLGLTQLARAACPHGFGPHGGPNRS